MGGQLNGPGRAGRYTISTSTTSFAVASDKGEADRDVHQRQERHMYIQVQERDDDLDRYNVFPGNLEESLLFFLTLIGFHLL
jgi:hypothetical protein